MNSVYNVSAYKAIISVINYAGFFKVCLNEIPGKSLFTKKAEAIAEANKKAATISQMSNSDYCHYIITEYEDANWILCKFDFSALYSECQTMDDFVDFMFNLLDKNIITYARFCEVMDNASTHYGESWR